MRLNENTCIVGKSVILVPYKEHHVPKYHNWMKSEELQHQTGSEPLTLQEEYEMQKSWHLDNDKCTFIVLDKLMYENGRDEIGDTNFFFSDDNRHQAEAEIMIAEEGARGNKRGWEAMLLMLRYGIEELDVKIYEVKIKLDNAVSIKMFTKIGFVEVSRSDVFSECTMQKTVAHEWVEWVNTETKSCIRSAYSELLKNIE
ncbi:N-acetyltransferase 9-like protein isoform X2 [Thrips palmi]|uniref:N-acetyltransferase 9-like protein isoform X2 n=1 Tax=Thrips palmi TaxID=161013 RepID=A0A6P8YPC3_THRPL|nr:N-acetyltransferase 9-like protein isoform X2 [Thrips palmi]